MSGSSPSTPLPRQPNDNIATVPQEAPQETPQEISREIPTEDFPRNRMQEENGVDLDAISDTSQRRQGNALGLSLKAAKNFAKEYRNKARDLRMEADKADKDAEKYEAEVARLNDDSEDIEGEGENTSTPLRETSFT